MINHLKKLVVVSLVIVLITSSCGLSETTQKESGDIANMIATSNDFDQPEGSENEKSDSNQSDSDDLEDTIEAKFRPFDASQIEITLDDDFVTKETIGANGGSFSVTDADGTEYTLVIPKGALLYDEEITMTPIGNVNGEVISEVFRAGVKLEPEGLHFLELVSIEIADPSIKEGAVGFTTQSGGENFHLIPSATSNGWLTITTTHFTEFGVSQEVINDINELGRLAGNALLEYRLSSGNNREQMAAFEVAIQMLIDKGETGIDVGNWESWSVDIISLILRLEEISSANEWDTSTPEFTNLIGELQNLVDLWFTKSELVVNDIRVKCINGEVTFVSEGQKIIEVGYWMINKFSLGQSRTDKIVELRNKLVICHIWGVTWQANVVTTGQGFESDISIGAERILEEDITFYPVDSMSITDLEVEYIQGFFENICVSKNGKITIEVDINQEAANLGLLRLESSNEIMVRVLINEQIFIDCGQGYSKAEAEAQAPFHGAALEMLNSERKNAEGYWEYKIEYDPGGGVIGQFEEGPLSMDWSEGNYKLWQLVTLYNAIPAD